MPPITATIVITFFAYPFGAITPFARDRRAPIARRSDFLRRAYGL